VIRPLFVAAFLAGTGVAAAQPSPQVQGDKVDAKALMQSGVKLLEAKDYLGALAVFRDAYARFPSAKILLNIGTTQNLLSRKVDAANTYQKYLDAPDTDPAKHADVATALADLDKAVGRLEITVTPPDAEVQINDGEWMPAAAVKLYRVPDGHFTVRARKDKFQPEAKSASIVTGEKAGIVINLTAVPETTSFVPSTSGASMQNPAIVAHVEAEERGKLAGIALVHLDIPRGGAAALVGIGYDVSAMFQVQATAILGPTYGAYAGAAFSPLDGKLRPYLAAGMPLFVSHGIRAGVRAAGGGELVITDHVSLIVEVGAEVMLNPEDDILKVAFIPAVGAAGRL
jgi:hypothetical protein